MAAQEVRRRGPRKPNRKENGNGTKRENGNHSKRTHHRAEKESVPVRMKFSPAQNTVLQRTLFMVPLGISGFFSHLAFDLNFCPGSSILPETRMKFSRSPQNPM